MSHDDIVFNIDLRRDDLETLLAGDSKTPIARMPKESRKWWQRLRWR